MLNTLTITAEQENPARDQAFYLLKKYSSFTFLDKARSLYQELLDTYVRMLNEPKHAAYQIDYKILLGFMVPIEKGLKLLRTTPHKAEAYKYFNGCTLPISDFFFGQMSREQGYRYQSFYRELGMPEDDSNPKEGVMKNISDMSVIDAKLGSCVIDRLIHNADKWELAMAFNFETLFELPYLKAVPSYGKPFCPLIYPFNFPDQLPPCPPHNLNSAGQIWSDEEIQITGIYEPWLTIGKVGCPNYFLAGQKAIEYQLEGTQDKEKVRWRLLWEDRRYLDGTIPDEEAHYLQDPSAAQPKPAPTTNQVLMADPSQPCPKAGLWFAPRLQNQTVRMQLGEPMPVQTMAPSGAVIWYYKGP